MTLKRSRGLLESPSVMDGDSERLAKTEQVFGNSGTLAQEMATGFLSQRGSLVSPSAMPDEGRERETVASSGRRLWQSSPQPGPSGCCLRMCLESSRWYSPIVRLEWQAKPLFSKVRMTTSQTTTPSSEELTETSDKQGTHQFTWLYQLAVSERRTDETGCGLLPTARVRDHKGGEKLGQRQLRGMHDGDDLPTVIGAMLPTPATRDYRSEKCSPETYDRNARPLSEELGTRTGMKLQPAFVEWMMGLPEGWTAIE